MIPRVIYPTPIPAKLSGVSFGVDLWCCVCRQEKV